MKIITSYNVRIKTEYITALKDTVSLYTDAVRYFIDIILKEWDNLNGKRSLEVQHYIESLTHATSSVDPKYPDFDIPDQCPR